VRFSRCIKAADSIIVIVFLTNYRITGGAVKWLKVASKMPSFIKKRICLPVVLFLIYNFPLLGKIINALRIA
jgi:hypothetical protein